MHHYCLLIGYGATAINPYLAFETLDDMIQQKLIEVTHQEAVNHYIKAVNKGIVKVMSKMGISTLQSYRGAQIFEAIGLNQSFVDRYLTLDRVPYRRHRVDGDCGRSFGAPQAGVPRSSGALGGSGVGRAVPVAA